MAGRVVTEQKKQRDAPVLAIGGRFKGFQPEEERTARKADVKEHEMFEKFRKAWRDFEYDRLPELDVRYNTVLALVKGISLTPKNMERLSLMLAESQYEKHFSEKAGLFLSALMNNGEEKDYVIQTRHFLQPIFFLGYRNTKNIEIYGDAGDGVGGVMESGTITVLGNAECAVGSGMKGGEIRIMGDAGYHIGIGMQDGKITVRGNVDFSIGYGMQGGEIMIEGNADELVGWNMKDGKITVKGNSADGVGSGMEGGRITVSGNAGHGVGSLMQGGSITIEGNAGNHVGLKMKGGNVAVEGSVGNEVGLYMEGGEIRFEGGYESLAGNIKGGRIYHKGEPIVYK
jgi:formylmethanofuran dehydrogenase subunit C